MRRTFALLGLPACLGACGGEALVSSEAGAQDPGVAFVDASAPPPNSACNPSHGVHAEAGGDQGALGCSSADGGALVLLKSLASTDQHMAIDDTNLYWAESDGVVKADKGGVPLTKFCVPQGGGVQAMIRDGAMLYVATSDAQTHTILRISTEGGDWRQVAAPSKWLTGLATDASRVFWREQDEEHPQNGYARIGQVGKDGAGAHIVVSAGQPVPMLSDGGDLFWVWNGAFALNLDGTAQPRKLAPILGYSTAVALDDTNVYWTGSGGGGAFNVTVEKVGKDGTGYALLANSGQSLAAEGLLVEGARVYWGESAMGHFGTLRIHRMDTSGGSDQVILAKPTAYKGTSNSNVSEGVLDFKTDATTLFFSTRVPSTPGPLYKTCK